jgi:hypothetical protein
MGSFRVRVVKARPGRVKVSVRSYHFSSCSRFSSGSATWSCISWAVAPGQAVTTVIALMVKLGSSARPSLKKAKVPATTMATIRNRVTARSRTARAERLKLIAPGRP